jgi:DNA-binding NarL/FixJ family response regulator
MRILVVAKPSMFHEGIEAILRQEPGLEIVGREEEPQEAIKLMKEASPDVILVGNGDTARRLAPELMCMVKDGCPIRMIEVHLATNTLCIYRGDQLPIREAADLLGTVRQLCHGLTPGPQLPARPEIGVLPA